MFARCKSFLAFVVVHFALIGSAFAATPDSNTYYRLSTEFRGGEMALDVFNGGPSDGFLHLVPKASFTGQYWRFTPNGDGTFKMTTQFRGPDTCLDVTNGGSNNNEPYLKDCGNFTGQRWMVVQDGHWLLLKTKFRGNDMCLDIFNGGAKNDQPQFRPCGRFTGQKWRLDAVKPVNRQVVHKICKWSGTAPACGGGCEAGWQHEGNARTDSQAKRITWIMPEGGMPRFGEDCLPFTSKALCCQFQ